MCMNPRYRSSRLLHSYDITHHKAATLSHSNSVSLRPPTFDVRCVKGTTDGLEENNDPTMQ